MQLQPLLLISVLATFLAPVQSQQLSCKDDNGNDVDWFLVQKFPKIKNTNGPATVAEGTAYRYILSSKLSLTLATKSINDDTSLVGRTLLQEQRNMFVLRIGYNDQTSTITPRADNRAHSKGAILVHTNTRTGVWMSHSIPNFPSIRGLLSNIYKINDPQLVKGQMLLCLTLNQPAIDSLGRHLYNMKANAFASEPATLVPQLQIFAPALHSVVMKDFSQQYIQSEHQATTRAGLSLRLFSRKVDETNQYDLWSTTVSSNLRANMWVQSWLCGSGGPQLGRQCAQGFCAESIWELRTPWTISIPGKPATNNYKTTKDHSKWAVSALASNPQICVGDLNRMTSQMKRGGGATCFTSAPAWTSMQSVFVMPTSRSTRLPDHRLDAECEEE